MQTIHRFTFLSVLILRWTSFRTENCLSALDIRYLFVDVYWNTLKLNDGKIGFLIIGTTVGKV